MLSVPAPPLSTTFAAKLFLRLPAPMLTASSPAPPLTVVGTPITSSERMEPPGPVLISSFSTAA